MQGVASKFIGIAVVAGALSMGACKVSGVGDPCIPESIPCDPNDPTNCGYNASESYVEASSVQCRTRVCLVHQLQGNPEWLCSDPKYKDNPNCISEQELDDRVYCSCRCDAPADAKEGANFQFCKCPSGYTCPDPATDPVLALGGDGIRGSYCVKNLENE